MLPEYFCLMGRQDTDKLAFRETPGNGPIQAFLAQAGVSPLPTRLSNGRAPLPRRTALTKS